MNVYNLLHIKNLTSVVKECRVQVCHRLQKNVHSHSTRHSSTGNDKLLKYGTAPKDGSKERRQMKEYLKH